MKRRLLQISVIGEAILLNSSTYHYFCQLLRLHYPTYEMPDSFFQSDKKRKRSKPGGGDRGGGGRAGPSSRSKPARRQPQEKDEDLSSGAEGEGRNVELDDMDFRAGRGGVDQFDDDELIDENETAAEKRVRMAKGYLAKVRKEIEDGGLTTECVLLSVVLIHRRTR